MRLIKDVYMSAQRIRSYEVVAMATVPFLWGLALKAQGNFVGEVYLNFVLATLAVTSTMLTFTADALFIWSGYRLMARHWKVVLDLLMSKKGRPKVQGWNNVDL